MSILSEIGAELSEYFTGDLEENDVILTIRGPELDERGKPIPGSEHDKVVAVIPDPWIKSIIKSLKEDCPEKMPELILEESFDYKHDKFVITSASPKGKKESQFSPGRMLSRLIYRKLMDAFRKEKE